MAFREGGSVGDLTGTNYREVVGAPTGDNTRVVKYISVLNRDTGDVTVELFLNDGGTRTQIASPTLSTYQAFEMVDVIALNSTTKSLDVRLRAAPAVTQPTFVTTYADVGTISSTAIAPYNAQYVVLQADASLTAERVLTATDSVEQTDAGAGGALTLDVNEIWLLEFGG